MLDALVKDPITVNFPQIDILLADADPAVCDSMCLLFEATGYSVHAVQGLDTLQAWLQDRKPRCLILALELGGVEVLTRLRDQGLTVPAIVTSAQGGVPLAVAAIRAGAFNFLEKPLLDARLLQTVRAALRT